MQPGLPRLLSAICIFIAVNGGCEKKYGSTGLVSLHPENAKAVGASARDLLTVANYTSLHIEIQYMPGFEPDSLSVANLQAFINLLINKPGGITITETMIPLQGRAVYYLADIEALEQQYRTVFTNGSTMSIYFLFVDGAYKEFDVLGFAYHNTSVCVFGKTIQGSSSGFGQPTSTNLFSTILEHETGHLLGLVDLGSAMVIYHQDPLHLNHCNNPDCLMNYAAQTSNIMNGGIPFLDASCRADLRANGGK